MEHMDKWKEHIDRERDEWDVDQPDMVGSWQAIEARLAPPAALAPPKPNYMRYWVAATVVLAALCVTLLFDRYQGPSATTALLDVEQEQVEDFSTTVAQFTSLIDARKAALEDYSEAHEAPLTSFQIDLAQLGAQYDELQLTLQDTQDPRVLRALIFNLEVQLQLLNEQLNALEITLPHAQPDAEI